MSLEKHEVDFFRHNGFVKFPTKLPEEDVEGLKAAALADIRNEVEPVDRNRKTGEIYRLSAVWERGGPFRDAAECDLVLNPLESLLGPNIELVLNRHNHFYLHEPGYEDQLHRDVLQWTRTIVTVLIYLEDSYLENGCTYVVPGSHLLPAFGGPREDTESRQIALEQAIPVHMPAGGCLAIDSMILHLAGTNHSDTTRMSLTFGYHSLDELSSFESPERTLIRGERIYHGNDKLS